MRRPQNLVTVSQLVVAEVLLLPYLDKNLEAVAQINSFIGHKNILKISEYQAGFMEKTPSLH